MMDWHPAMVRLGKSVQELAQETIEEIMGFQGKGGHKPARPDIQKMKDVYDLYNGTYDKDAGRTGEPVDPEAAKEWHEKYELNDRERMAVEMYQFLLKNGATANDPQKAFQFVVSALVNGSNGLDTAGFVGHEQDAKRFVGGALKKYEQQHWPMLYTNIKDALDDAYRRGPLESYKLWPRMVQWIKDQYQDWLQNTTNAVNRPSNSVNFAGHVNHLVDIATEGGSILDRLRRENRLPQNFDANKLDASDFETWLMDWKRENRDAESQGEVVYQYHDGWTMQKLTTPEQLQYEGDEMGHCVGGYAHQVGSGSDIIYSLRDPKGKPHVTMEIQALEGAPSYGFEGSEEPPEDAIFNHEYIHPEAHAPGEHMEDVAGGYEPSGGRAFQVVQVQGNSNHRPKPEYQHKVKEFLDGLRSKGWKFERSHDWYGNEEDRYGGGDGEYGERVQDARELDDWYDDHYKAHHELYRGVNNEDSYGLPSERMTIGVSDWDDLFKSIFNSLTHEYDPGKWQGNWRDLAQAVYHAWFIDIYKDHLDPAALEKHRQNLVDEIQSAEQTLHDWVDENWYYQEEYAGDQIADKIKEEADKNGELDKIEQALEVSYGEDGWTDSELVEWVRENDESLYYDATDKLRDEATDDYAGDAYKFCNYIIQLAEKFGGVNPQELPDPNQRHGGLPSYEELQEMPWKPDPQQQQTPVEEGLPGALGGWHAASSPGDDYCPKCGSENVYNDPVNELLSQGRCLDCGQAWESSMMSNEQFEEEMRRKFGAAADYQIYPIDREHNVWFDEDGNAHERYRPQWMKNPVTDEWLQSANELEDTFLDKQGRQGEGWVAYHGDKPIGSLTYVADPAGWNMLGTTYVHPDYRQQGLFNRMVAPLREEGKPIDAYVWNNPWLKNKVRGWSLPAS